MEQQTKHTPENHLAIFNANITEDHASNYVVEVIDNVGKHSKECDGTTAGNVAYKYVPMLLVMSAIETAAERDKLKEEVERLRKSIEFQRRCIASRDNCIIGKDALLSKLKEENERLKGLIVQ